VRLPIYGYCRGVASSRRIERATYEDVAFRYLAADPHPGHDTLAAIRQEQLTHLAQLFVQVLKLCQRAGLVKLGHVALDGTKVKANASKFQAMSYERMDKSEKELETEVQALLAEAALEQEARAAAERKRVEVAARLQEREKRERERGKKFGGRPPQVPDPEQTKPKPSAQRNFTDPDSRIMKGGATKAFVQGYNAQAVVDRAAQVIVVAAVTQEANDKRQLAPMLQAVQAQRGVAPKPATADHGYFSAVAINEARLPGIELLVAADREKHGTKAPAPSGPAPETASATEKMRHKLLTPEGRAIYAQRKAVVEPVFGQIKEARGFRRFLLRGLEKVRAEWQLICATHNLLKLYRCGGSLQNA